MAAVSFAYGLDPKYEYTGSTFGIVNGALWHSFSYSCGDNCTSADPVYSTALVNTLVRGYRYTGDIKYYDKARVMLNRGTKGEYDSLKRTAPDNEVHHFIDTIFSSGDDYFFLNYNKGELFYTYLIFENGGR
jgi:hypothetical protein